MEIEKNNSMLVLMLDHEPILIDRRIVLEGKTLVKAGYAVYLATRGDGLKPAIEMFHGIEVRRFCDPLDEALANPKSPAGQRAYARQKIATWINSAGNTELEQSIRKGKPGFLNSVAYAFCWPPALAHVLRHRYPWAKMMMGRMFEPLIYTSMLRLDFLIPYLILAKHYFWKIYKHQENEIDLLQENWKSRLYRDAIDLKPNFVHAHDLPNLEMGCKIAEEIDAALIYDAHELYPRQYFSDERRRKRLLDLERKFIARADAIITINKQCVDVLETEYGVSNVVAITNATEAPANFNPTIRLRKWHERFSLMPDIKIMVFQGGINPVRNIDPLIKALPYCDDNIHIGFITYRQDVPYYENMARNLGVSERIHYVLEIPWDEVNDWLASADVGIMPYQVTNFNAKISSPNKLYEFVVAGLPIMASTELVNVKKAVEEDGLGVLNYLKEYETYVELIKKMFDHPEGPTRFKNNVLAARHKYMWSAEAPKILECYAAVANKKFYVAPDSPTGKSICAA